MRPFSGPGSLDNLYKTHEKAQRQRQLLEKQQEEQKLAPIRRIVKNIVTNNLTELEREFFRGYDHLSQQFEKPKITPDNIKDIVALTAHNNRDLFLNIISNIFLHSDYMKAHKRNKDYKTCAIQYIKQHYQDIYDRPCTHPSNILGDDIVDSQASTPIAHHGSKKTGYQK